MKKPLQVISRNLRRLRKEAHQDLDRIDQAIEILGAPPKKAPQRVLSTAARKKIGEAQRARWALWHRKQKRAA